MKQKLKSVFSIVILFILLPRTKSAVVTTTEDLLKYYPLNSQEYEALSKLIDQQSVVTENHLVSTGYRSLADWSQAMPHGWNSIFNMKRRSPRTKVGYGGYPLCVLKANGPWKKGRQYDIQEDFEYAGVAPNIDYSIPSYTEYVYEQPTYIASDPIEYNSGPVYSYPSGTGQINSQNGSPNPKPGVKINCIVVVRRYGRPPGSGTNTSTTTTPSTSTTPMPTPITTTTTTPTPTAYPTHPGYPYPYPHPYPHPKPTPPYIYYPRPPHHYPPHPHPHPSPQCDPPPEGFQDLVAAPAMSGSELDSVTLDRLGQMLNEYYQQLVQLVRAQSVTTA